MDQATSVTTTKGNSTALASLYTRMTVLIEANGTVITWAGKELFRGLMVALMKEPGTWIERTVKVKWYGLMAAFSMVASITTFEKAMVHKSSKMDQCIKANTPATSNMEKELSHLGMVKRDQESGISVNFVGILINKNKFSTPYSNSFSTTHGTHLNFSNHQIIHKE